MKVFLTGVNGLLGHSLNETFSKANHEVFYQWVDIREKDNLKKEIKNFKPDIIIHTAAITDVDKCENEKELCRDVNVIGTENLLNIAKGLNIPIFYISTVSVFDAVNGDYQEGDSPNPINFYNQTKFEGENIVLSYEKGFVIRINVIGIHEIKNEKDNFFEWALNSIRNNQDMNLYNDVFINPLSNWTISEFILNIVEKKDLPQIMHIGSKNKLSKAEIVKKMIDMIGDYTGKVNEISIDTVLNAQKLKKMWLNTSNTERRINIRMPILEGEIEKY